MKKVEVNESGNTVQQCRDKAYVYLGMREHNRHELSVKLRQKGFPPEVVEATLDSLEKENSLSERRYVQSFIRSSNRRHPEGKGVVLARLLSKGADRSVCREVLDEVYTEDYTASLVAAAREALERKGKTSSPEEMRACLVKLGFSSRDLAEIS